MGKVNINIEYPPTIQPGEDRFFNRGIEIDSFKGKIYLEIRCSDITITSMTGLERNKIPIEGTATSQYIPLHYLADKTALINSKKEIGVFIYEKSILWRNLIFLILGSVIWLSPTLLLLFRPSIIDFKIGIGEFFIINIPQYVLFTLLFSLKRVSLIFEKMITYKVTHTVFKESYGVFDFVTIKESSRYTKDNLFFSFDN